MQSFKNGDKVYLPTVSRKVLTVKINPNEPNCYSICPTGPVIHVMDGNVEVGTIYPRGKYDSFDSIPPLFPATERNRELLEELYDVQFQKPVEPSLEPLLDALRGLEFVALPHIAIVTDNQELAHHLANNPENALEIALKEPNLAQIAVVKELTDSFFRYHTADEGYLYAFALNSNGTLVNYKETPAYRVMRIAK